VSRYDDPRWYEEQGSHSPYPFHAYDNDASQQPSFYMPDNDPAQGNSSATHSQTQNKRRLPGALGTILSLVALVAIAFLAGWFAHAYFVDGAFPGQSSQSKANEQLINQAWNTIDQNYVDRKAVNYKQMAYAAINAMVTTLNDKGHTRFLTPSDVQSENQQLSGKFTGIGIYIHQDPQTKQLIINSTIPGSPAQKAGLQPNDVIIAVNGVSTAGKDVPGVSSMIQGPAGTSVSITVQRAGQANPLTFKIERQQIEVPNVLMHYIPEDHIADIQIIQFSSGVSGQLKSDVLQAKKMGATKIVLDLRDNPGGYLSEAIDTVSLFQGSGNVLLTQDSKGQRTPVPVNGNPIDTTTPIVVLVNNNTASAAEIVSGALKDSHRATIIGEKTYGTGTVLQQYNLADGSAILLGTQEWLTPDGQFIRNQGIQPDVTISLPANATVITPTIENEENLSLQQILNSDDTQLKTAIQHLDAQR
jgi:carboxyl-terminal processing protease